MIASNGLVEDEDLKNHLEEIEAEESFKLAAISCYTKFVLMDNINLMMSPLCQFWNNKILSKMQASVLFKIASPSLKITAKNELRQVVHVIQFQSTKIWIVKWRKWYLLHLIIDEFQEN